MMEIISFDISQPDGYYALCNSIPQQPDKRLVKTKKSHPHPCHTQPHAPNFRRAI